MINYGINYKFEDNQLQRQDLQYFLLGIFLISHDMISFLIYYNLCKLQVKRKLRIHIYKGNFYLALATLFKRH